MEKEVNNVMFTLDITYDVIKEAVDKEIDLIIAHHPVIFFPLRSINYDSYYASLVKELIVHDLAVISAHTNYDVGEHGMNFQLLDALKVENIQTLPEVEYISYGEVDQSLDQFLDVVRSTFNRNEMRYVGNKDVHLKKVAVTGGSGGVYEWIDIVKQNNIDLFITSDVKSPVARYAKEQGVNILDVSHNVEEIFGLNLYSLFEEEELNLYISKINTDPFDFL
jgi:dinuclear metal center YbgI/SA1388 family protein